MIRPAITLEELTSQMNELKKQAREQGQGLFKSALSDYFAKHPIAEAVTFAGWIPYFNDGDECKFYIHEYYTTVNGQGEETDTEEDQISKTLWQGYETANGVYTPKPKIPNPNYNPELEAAYQDLCKIINSVPNETFQDMFGNHFKVRATPEALEVEAYTDHD